MVRNLMGKLVLLRLSFTTVKKFTTVCRLPDHASVFAAEIKGMDMAITIVQGLTIWDPVRIYTDSLSLLQALASTVTVDPVVWSLKQKCLELMGTRNLGLFWVKAHVGVTGNEAADKYAKAATTRPSIDIELLKTVSDFKREVKSELVSLWQTRWVQAETGRQTAQYFPMVDFTPKLFNSKIMQIITGHGRFPYYFKRFNFLTTDLCRCGCFRDANHYVYECQSTSDLRSRLHFDPAYPPSLFEVASNMEVLNAIVTRVVGFLPNL
ncbi:hypothetical protein AVEN_46007-1 [Araneus ventricosus]|uniref:RNase H type-1 domain-containing protein n=1 Tax=Araneus ventricosus TaxID=182803 RepID=A0A4Y2F4T5_ARAVE|nr:hypothetical protein AVEN_46007-1 [Araneus ventricosus]